MGAGASGRATALIAVGVSAGVFFADQASKQWAEATLTEGSPQALLGEILKLRLIYNSGAAFGMGGSATALITCVQIALSVGIAVGLVTVVRNRLWALSLALLLGGALGNVFDRIFREPGPFIGHVVDFLELPNWPIFNVADIAVTSGAVLLVLLTFLNVPSGSARGSERSAS